MASKGGIGIWDLPPVKQLCITIHGSCMFMIYMDYHNNIFIWNLYIWYGLYIFIYRWYWKYGHNLVKGQSRRVVDNWIRLKKFISWWFFLNKYWNVVFGVSINFCEVISPHLTSVVSIQDLTFCYTLYPPLK